MARTNTHESDAHINFMIHGTNKTQATFSATMLVQNLKIYRGIKDLLDKTTTTYRITRGNKVKFFVFTNNIIHS